MKTKHIQAALAALLTLSLVAGCASQKNSAKDAPESKEVPDFFLNPPSRPGQFFGLGSARFTNDNTSRLRALKRAQEDLAYQMSTHVRDMLLDYVQDSGADDTIKTARFVEDTVDQVAGVKLKDTIVEEQYPADDGTWYVMISLSEDRMIDQIGTILTRNEETAFAGFRTGEALTRLAQSLKEDPPISDGPDSPVNRR